MKIKIAALVATLLASPLFLAAQGPECRVEARWLMEARGWVIEMVRSGDRWGGSIVDFQDPEVRPGAPVFRDLVWDQGEHRFSGTMIRPDSGREVRVDLTCVDADTLEVTARLAFIRRSFLLHRSAPPGEGTITPTPR